MARLKKDPQMGDVIERCRSITLVNAVLKPLAKQLELIFNNLVYRTQKLAVPSRCIHDNLHLMHYIIERIVKEPGFGWTLINLHQSKAFDRLDY